MAGGIDLPNLSAVASPDQQAAILDQARSAQLMDYPKLSVGTVFRDKFRIDAEIGQGASAVVYRARDVDAEMDVALKVVGVVGGQADGIRQAWAEEYKARGRVADGSHLLKLESPQVQEIDGTTYVALPQELGEMTLRDWLNEARSDIAQHREEALRLFGEVCRGVEALHDNKLAHLDLKPENIILVQAGKDRLVAKVGDFGLARAVGGMQRREGVGTPKYMAPEQVRSAREKDIGPWSDIYALGCILFELLDGDPPFSGSAEELKDKHLNMAPPELEDIPGHIESLVMACLAKTRKDRPNTAAELRQAIQTNPEEEKAFEQARKKDTEATWEAFLKKWGDGRHAEAARTELEKQVAKREAREKAEAERKAREEAERKAQERAEAERQKQEERERAREEAERKAREEVEKKDREKAEGERRKQKARERQARDCPATITEPGSPNLTKIGEGGRRPDFPKLPVGKVFRDKFRIDAEIGQGASAVVYRARDVDVEIDVALKVVGVVGGQNDGIRQAWAEAYKVRRRVADGSHLLSLECPLVQEIDGTTYVALPQELGEMTLRDWLNEARSDIAAHRDEALRLFGEVCRGVEALHDNDLEHLDLKPENIILVQAGKDRLVAKVGDFGLARAAGGMQRREGVGTPKYMAPEQVRSAREKDIGPWSDIYALGCILFELLDGAAPFSGNSEDLKDKHLSVTPPELEDVPGHLASLVMACMAKKRKDRPDTVAELRQAINELDQEAKREIVISKVRVPAFPGLVSDAAVANLFRKPGDGIKEEDDLMDLETDTVVLTVPSPKSGVLKKLFVRLGDKVIEGDLLATIEVDELEANHGSNN